MLFVTHDINPMLGMVDRVLYLAGGRFRIGTPDEVLRSEVLTELYDTPVEVIRSRGRVVVLGAPEGYGVHDHLEHHACRRDRSRDGRLLVADLRLRRLRRAARAACSNSILAGAVLGVVGGLIGVFVMTRDLAFAVHGISELSFAGASAALLFGVDVVVGSIVGSLLAALLIGVLGARARDRNSIIAVLMPFGLGLGILFLALYPGRAPTSSGC